MKQRYTITIADMEMNVISEESPETVEALVGIVDRKMREIMTASRRCTKGEAALLCSLEYCSDKLKALRHVKQKESELLLKSNEIEELRRELEKVQKKNEKLETELETVRESLRAAKESAAAGLAEPAPEANGEDPAQEIPQKEQAEEPSSFVGPEQIKLDLTEEKTEPVSESEPEKAEAPVLTVPPEDVEFDPTEIFARAKKNRDAKRARKPRR